MKLFSTTSLLLVAETYAGGNSDGNYGPYTMIDWAAVFAEQYLIPDTSTSLVYNNCDTCQNVVGLAPQVTAVLSLYDGGKALTGYGKFDNTTYFGWVMKLFGTSGTNNKCAEYQKPTGYQTFTTTKKWIAYSTDPATCTTHTQFVVIEPAALVANRAQSSIYLSLAEEVHGSTFVPIMYVGGGLSPNYTYGLGNYWALVHGISVDGAINTTLSADATGYAESTHKIVEAANTNMQGLDLVTNGCTTSMDSGWMTASSTLIAGGTTGGPLTCIDWAVDGFTVSGQPFFYQFAGDFAVSLTNPANAEAIHVSSIYTTAPQGQTGTQWHSCGITTVQTLVDSAYTGSNVAYLCSGRELYGPSYLVGVKKNAFATTDVKVLATADYGSTHSIYGFAPTAADKNLITTRWTHVVAVGTMKGKGIWHTHFVTANATDTALAFTAGNTNPIFTNTTSCVVGTSTNVCSLPPPTGGILQFKGLKQGTQEDKYVEVYCKGVQPMFWTTYPQYLSTGANNGFMLTCMTGIPQCAEKLTYDTASAQLTTAERAACLADPRYLTYRVMTVKIGYTGGLVWYRTDSYWNGTDTKAESTWGAPLKLSASYVSGKDNNGTTNIGKTYIFAMSDGSGVSLNHLTYNTYAPTNNTQAGTGENIMTVTKARSSYTNKFPNLYEMDHCSDAQLLISADTNTEDIATDVKKYSDGYMMTSTIALQQVLTGEKGGWKGYCVVYYSDATTLDNDDGSICHVHLHDSLATAGPHDFGAQYLIHILPANWTPPQASGSVSPAGMALTDNKYGLVFNPASTATTRGNIQTAGYYATLSWYQPKAAASYTLVRRYARSDQVKVYCMAGAGSTSYFSDQEGVDPWELQSAIALVGGASLLSSFIAF